MNKGPEKCRCRVKPNEGPHTFFVKRDRGYFFLVKRDLSFYLFVIRDRPSPDNFYVHVKAVLELSVTRDRTFELNVIRELYCFV